MFYNLIGILFHTAAKRPAWREREGGRERDTAKRPYGERESETKTHGRPRNPQAPLAKSSSTWSSLSSSTRNVAEPQGRAVAYTREGP